MAWAVFIEKVWMARTQADLAVIWPSSLLRALEPEPKGFEAAYQAF